MFNFATLSNIRLFNFAVRPVMITTFNIRYQFLCAHVVSGWMKSGDDSGKTYKGTIEIPNLSEEHSPEDVDITVLTDDRSENAATLKEFIRVKGADKIREQLGQYIAILKLGQLVGI